MHIDTEKLGPQVRNSLGRVKLRSHLRRHVAPAGLASLALLGLVLALWLQAAPRGADTWAHLARAEFLAEEVRLHGPRAWASAAWMPTWYLGDPFRTYYPPLTTLFLAPLSYLLGETLLTFRVAAALLLLAFATLTYLILAGLFGPWPAGVGTVMALWAPYQVRTLWFEGNLPRLLSLLALPVLLWLGERLLTAPGRRAPTVAMMAATWVWAILAHTQQAYIFAVALALYTIGRLFIEPSLPGIGLAWWTGSLGLGAMLAAPWLMPAYSGEFADVPFLPAEKVEAFAATPSGLLPTLDMADGQIVIGLGVVLLALLAMAARPHPRRTALTVVGVLCLWFSIGDRGVAFSLLPLQAQLLPERFLNVGSYLLVAAACGLVPMRRERWVPRAMMLAGLIALDAAPAFSLLRPTAFPHEQALLAGIRHGGADPIGRIALLIYPEPTAAEVYFAGQSGELLQGWALENTPHQVALRRVLGAPAWGPDYLVSRLSLWDVRTVVVGGGESAKQAEGVLRDAGYRLEGQLGPYAVWEQGRPSARVQRIPQGQMLVIGDQLAPLLVAFPFAEEVRTQHASWLGLDRVSGSSAVALYRFEIERDLLAEVEDWLVPYLEAGGRAIIDLSGMEDLVGQTADFLGVHAIRLSLEGSVPLTWDASLKGLPGELVFQGEEGNRWLGAAYQGLDRVLGELTWEGNRYGVLGYRQVGRGQAWFVGLNLFYYARIVGQPEIATALGEAVLAELQVPDTLALEAVPISGYEETPWSVTFGSHASEGGSVVLAYTYSPRWKALVDGRAIRLTNYEGLIRFDLPAGEHRVEVLYRPLGSVWPRLGLAVGVLGLVTAVGLVGVERRFFRLQAAAKPEIVAESISHLPCANCGFRLAEVAPPTGITYPFKVVSCSVCGMSMDDEGFRPGVPLTPAARAAALDRWLREHGYDPATVHERWGFSVEDFFAPEAERQQAAVSGPEGA